MKHEEEIRKIIELQAKVAGMQKEVSKILDEIIEKSVQHTDTKFVLDGVLWEVGRWPGEGTPTGDYFSAWCLKNRGKVIS
jgi:hypothetical protein